MALFNAQNCGTTRPEGSVDAEQSVFDQDLHAMAEATGSIAVDLDPHYCSEGVCRTNMGNRWMFRDGYHITVAESEALASTFVGPLRLLAL